jgi:predicted O-methyltransferase YrrM
MTKMSNPIIREIYDTGKVYDQNGNQIDVWAQVTEAHCTALYRTVLKYRPQSCVEIGMACGLSTLAILAALRDVGEGGQLISIDPFQSTERKGVGVANVKRAGYEDIHTLIEAFDYAALPRLLGDGTRVDFGYIDGWHTFDYTLLDFFYLDKMLPVGGVIGFNDCGVRAIHRVLKFVKTHRHYKEIDVGLKPDYHARNFLYVAARKFLDFKWNDRYFEKSDDWEPDNTFFYSRF